MLATLLLTAALVTPTPEPPFQPNRAQLIASASGMAKYKPVLGPMIARAMLVDVVTSAGPRTSGGLGSGGLVGGDLYLADLIDINLASTGVIRWSATTDPTAAKDLGFSRPSAGLVKVTNGGTGIGALQVGKLTLTALGTPATPVITQGGAGGATAYSYFIVAKLPDATTSQGGAVGSTATGNAVLDAVNYNIVTWAATTNAHCYDVYRTVGGATQGKIADCVSSPTNDTGLAGDGVTTWYYNITGLLNGLRIAKGAGLASIVVSGDSGAYPSAAAGTGAIAIGHNNTASANYSIALGAEAAASATQAMAIGPNTIASASDCVALGNYARCDVASSFAGGYGTHAHSTGSTSLGGSAAVGTTSDYSIALGYATQVPNATPNTLVAGVDAYPISNLYFGDGVTSATPTAYTINGGGALGSDIVGGDLQLAPGISTGLAVPASVIVRGTEPIGTGATAQTLGTVFRFSGGPKVVVDNTATAFVRISVADDDYETIIVSYSVYAEDADTDARQVTGGIATFAILNTSGAESCTLPTNYNNYIQATNVTAGSLAVTFDCSSAVADTIDLRVTADTSLDAAAETLKIEYAVQVVSGTATVTPQ
jgi:hypothetical protein